MGVFAQWIFVTGRTLSTEESEKGCFVFPSQLGKLERSWSRHWISQPQSVHHVIKKCLITIFIFSVATVIWYMFFIDHLFSLFSFMLPPVFHHQTAPREAPLLEVYPGTWLCMSACPCAPEVCWWLFLVIQPWVWPFCSLPQPCVTFHCLAPFDGFVVRAVLVLLTMWLTAFFSFPLVVLCDLWEEREEADFTLTFFKPTSFSKLFLLLCVPSVLLSAASWSPLLDFLPFTYLELLQLHRIQSLKLLHLCSHPVPTLDIYW